MDFEKIFGFSVIKDYLKNREYKSMLGATLFPETKIQDIDLAYIKGANNLPVSASIHGFDTETEIASRETIDYVKERLALIKRKIKMGEELLIKLQTPRTNAEFEKAKEQVFNDIDKMVIAVKTRIEAMRMEALTSGQIKVNENGAVITVDYSVPSGNIKTLGGTSIWTDNSSQPIKDIFSWTNDLVNSSGVTPTRALTSNIVLANILSNDSVRKAMYGTNTSKMISKKDLNDFLEAQDLPKIATYDEKYRVQGKDGKYTTKRYFDEDKFVMFGDGELGETVYGLTPEEVELQGKAGNEISEQDKIIVQIYDTKDPVAKWTKAVATALPTFPQAGEIIIAKVK